MLFFTVPEACSDFPRGRSRVESCFGEAPYGVLKAEFRLVKYGRRGVSPCPVTVESSSVE